MNEDYAHGVATRTVINDVLHRRNAQLPDTDTGLVDLVETGALLDARRRYAPLGVTEQDWADNLELVGAYVAALTVPLEALRAIEKIVEQHPNTKNPIAGAACMYRREQFLAEAGGTVIDHCLIGHLLQVFWRFTYNPNWETSTASSVARRLGFGNGTCRILSTVQQQADLGSSGPGVRTWSDAWDAFRTQNPRYFDTTGAVIRVQPTDPRDT